MPGCEYCLSCLHGSNEKHPICVVEDCISFTDEASFYFCTFHRGMFFEFYSSEDPDGGNEIEYFLQVKIAKQFYFQPLDGHTRNIFNSYGELARQCENCGIIRRIIYWPYNVEPSIIEGYSNLYTDHFECWNVAGKCHE